MMPTMQSRRPWQRGLTLIELMVTLVIGMVMALALFTMLANSEGNKRDTAGVNDAEQGGELALYLLDQWGRSAGAGFAALSTQAYGCPLTSTQLPAASLPAPFTSVSGTVRLAPMMIVPGATTPGVSGQPSDALIVMGGTDGLGGAPLVNASVPTAAALTLNNALPVNAGDLLLLIDPAAGTPATCVVTQASSVAGTGVSLGGTFQLTSLPVLTDQTVALTIGSATAGGSPPQFMLVGVGDNDTLYSYDLLQVDGTGVAQPRVQGVFEMHAIYGVNTLATDDGTITSWVSPQSGTYAYSNLTAGTAAAAGLLSRIKAVRVALILQIPLKEKLPIGPTSLTWFNDLAASGLNGTRALSTTEQLYRYRVVEATLPLRNNLMVY